MNVHDRFVEGHAKLDIARDVADTPSGTRLVAFRMVLGMVFDLLEEMEDAHVATLRVLITGDRQHDEFVADVEICERAGLESGFGECCEEGFKVGGGHGDSRKENAEKLRF